jgi:hypothetical protein
MSGETSAVRRGLSRWGVRGLALAGALCIFLASFGWWLDSRVLSDAGFADVVAQASQKPEVRHYIADQATLRLARTSNFVSAARPVVTDAIATAIATPPVEDAVREFAFRAHEQVLRTQEGRRVDLDAQQAATTIRSALQTINPSLSKKLPANVLDASATVSQNSAVDTAFQVSKWIWLWIPIGILGVGLLGLALAKADDRVRAVRTVGMYVAVAGALLVGLGGATPIIGAVVSSTDPGRAEAIAAFIEVLTGRLVGAGLALVLVGLCLAFAPGKDGGDLKARWARYRAYWSGKRSSARWRFAGGLAVIALAALVLTQLEELVITLVEIAAIVAFYVGVILCLRAAGILVVDHSIPRIRKRQVVGVFATMIAAFLVMATLAVTIVAANTTTPTANPDKNGCNGYIELCLQPLDQVVWPASHNAMSSSAYNFFSAEHTITVGEQLNAGVRFLMLDAYYGYDDDGLVRTNLAGGVDRKQLEKDRGQDAVDALDRMGALTGTADTSGKKQTVYFCHDFCELGAVKASDVFAEIKAFLDRNLTEVVILDFEDYVQPKDMRAALREAGLLPRLRVLDRDKISSTTLLDIVQPKRKKAKENPRRLIALAEKHGNPHSWLRPAYDLYQETPYTFPKIDDFSCAPKRGASDNPLFLVNHWLRPSGPPDPSEAAKVNSKKTLTARFTKCAQQRRILPNALAVDFTEIGDLTPTVNRMNGAIAALTGAEQSVDTVIRHHIRHEDLTDAEVRELRGIHRLPRVKPEAAVKLLGQPVASELRPAIGIPQFEELNGLGPKERTTTAAAPGTTPTTTP